jgi:hypothetical protein
MIASSDILTDVPDAKPVRVFLPIAGSKERYRACGVYQKTEPPRFNLLFQPGVLPADALDVSIPCLIVIDMGGPNISVEAMITSAADQKLEMIVQKTVSHDQMREFFRVDAATQVISKSFQPELFGKKETPWSMQGTTIDISGSGLLAAFPGKVPMDEPIRLEITLPTEPPELVKVLAHPVRAVQIDDNRWEVAFHFDDISIEDRDKIIGCCLVIQRRLLRLKVQVRDIAK